MAFVLNNWGRGSSTVSDTTTEYRYKSSTDTLATIATAAYFNGVKEALNIDDTIYIVGSDGAALYSVSAVSPDVTIGQAASNSDSTTLTAAQFIGMYANPVELVAAPGAGLMHVVDRVEYFVDYGTAQFTGGGVVTVQYGATVNGGGLNASADTAAALFNGYTADSTVGAVGASESGAAASKVNAGLYLSNETAAFATGDSVITVKVWYDTVAAPF